jgi:hypothetical protein
MEPLVDHLIEERLRRLLAAIARDIGIADHLRTDDLGLLSKDLPAGIAH